MRDDDHARSGDIAHLLEEFDDLILDRDIEPGGRFVGDQQFGRTRDRHGDHHPLRHPARELMGERLQPALRFRNVDGAEQTNRFARVLPRLLTFLDGSAGPG